MELEGGGLRAVEKSSKRNGWWGATWTREEGQYPTTCFYIEPCTFFKKKRVIFYFVVNKLQAMLLSKLNFLASLTPLWHRFLPGQVRNGF